MLRGRGARRLADVDVLPLLPRPRRPQHARRTTASAPSTHKLIYYWKKDQWELFDLVNDPAEMNNLYGQPGQEEPTRTLKAELARLKAEVKDDDQFANEQPPNGVDGTVAKLRGK